MNNLITPVGPLPIKSGPRGERQSSEHEQREGGDRCGSALCSCGAHAEAERGNQPLLVWRVRTTSERGAGWGRTRSERRTDDSFIIDPLERCAGAGADWLRWVYGGCVVVYSSSVFAALAEGVWCHPILQKVGAGRGIFFGAVSSSAPQQSVVVQSRLQSSTPIAIKCEFSSQCLAQ